MKILIAEDEVVSRRLIETSVRRWGYEVVLAADGLEAARILQEPDAPRLAILDWMMPGLDGVQLCRRLREKKDETYSYLILLSSKHTRDDVVKGLEAGADDYIVKPFDPQELRVRLRTGKRILCLLEQLVTAREALRDLASRDSLTGMWNHSAIIEILKTEIDRAQRQESNVGVILVDLDRFKTINDTHGHLVGDHVLREVAKVFDGCLRPYDAAGRMGGEEFLIVLPGSNQINSTSHAERLRLALSQASVDTPAGRLHFTASFGVSVVGSESQLDAHTAIHAADTAMYRAKQTGRNRVEFNTSCDTILTF